MSLSAPGPLAGIRVLSVEQYGAGPYGTMYMADLGAEVIKIEAPGEKNVGGDSARWAGPHFLGEGDSHFFQTFNRGKQSLTLNLRDPRGQDILHRLTATADAVCNNLKGDAPGKLGLTHAALAPYNDKIVCGHLSGYGRVGPRAAWPAYDYLAQAEAGFMAVTGEPDGPPQRMGLSIIDYLGGLTFAFSLTAAILGALKTGKGRDVDVSLYDVAMHQLTYPATWYLNEGDVIERRPRSGHPAVVPCEAFPTQDGWIFVMCVLPKFWQALCRLTGLDGLLDDPRFADGRCRYTNRDALAAVLDEVFATKTTDAWMAILGGQVPVAPVLNLPDALDNPYLHAQGGVQTVDHPQRPGLRMLAGPIRLDGERPDLGPGPALGADTDTVLSSLGIDPAEIADLRGAGVI